MVQAEPFKAKAVGRGFDPVWVPFMPKLADAPGASAPFQLALVTVTWVPDWVAVADQACDTRCPAV
jgi:hypothetical protein